MARKKLVKANKGKKIIKKTRSARLNPTAALEKEFHATPNTLVAHYRKEMGTLQQHESKLKNALKKADAKKKVAKTKHDALVLKNKTKATPQLKKQIIAAKKIHATHTQTATELAKKLDLIKSQCKALADKQAKVKALHVVMVKFEKSWGKNEPSKAKTTRKTKSATVKPVKKADQDIVFSQPTPESHSTEWEHMTTTTTTEKTHE